jgi:hypothetical protein
MASRSLKLPCAYALCVSHTQDLLVAVGRKISLADLASRRKLASWRVFSHPSHAALAPDGSTLVVKSTSGEIAVLQMPGGEVLVEHRPPRNQNDEGAVARFSRCGHFLVEGSWSGEIRVRRAASLEVERDFKFPDEMITHVSHDRDRVLWLFAHQPKVRDDENFPPAPYLSCWTWPFLEAPYIVDPCCDCLYAAEVSPSGAYIAVRGFSRKEGVETLKILSSKGEFVASTPVDGGGTGASTRWSSDSLLVGTVARDKYSIYRAPSLSPVTAIQDEYPSDLAFLSESREVVLGSWNGVRIHSLPSDA